MNLQKMHTYLGAVQAAGCEPHAMAASGDKDGEIVADASALESLSGLRVQKGFFKVIHSNPGAQKLLRRRAGAGQTLVKGDMILSHVGMVEQSSSNFTPTFAASSTLSVVTGMQGAFLDLRQHGAKAWDVQPGVYYWLPGINGPEAQAALGDFVRSGAYNSDSAVLVPPHDEDRLEVLSEMLKSGHAAECTARHGFWYLTGVGLSSLQLVQKMSNPRPLCEPALGFELKALGDMSNFEMLTLLDQRGWQWRPLPHKSRREGLAVQFHSGAVKDGDRIFYGGFKHMYISTLVTCEREPKKFTDLGHTSVLHFQQDRYYDRLLRGQGPLQLDAVADDIDSGNSSDAVLDDEELLALARDLGLGHGEEEAELSEEDAGDAAEGALAPAPAPQPQAPAMLAAAPPASAAQPPPLGQPFATGFESRQALEKYVAGHTGLDIDDKGKLRWGAFQFTYKEDGSWQATCPWHKRSKITVCKKTRHAGTTNISHFESIRYLKSWCVTARLYDRQRTHLAAPLDMDSVPPHEVLDAKPEKHQRPSRPPVDDRQLDDDDVTLEELMGQPVESQPAGAPSSSALAVSSSSKGRKRSQATAAPAAGAAASSGAGGVAASPGPAAEAVAEAAVAEPAKRRRRAKESPAAAVAVTAASASASSSRKAKAAPAKAVAFPVAGKPKAQAKVKGSAAKPKAKAAAAASGSSGSSSSGSTSSSGSSSGSGSSSSRSSSSSS